MGIEAQQTTDVAHARIHGAKGMQHTVESSVGGEMFTV